MSERDRYIPGVPCWVDTSQPDPAAAVDFYSRLFGWDVTGDVSGAGSDSAYFVARIRDEDVAGITALPDETPPTAMWNTYVWVDSADETASKVSAAGGTVLAQPFDADDAGRMAVCADPEGAVFCLWEAKNHRGAGIVNEHGSVNFNGLH